MSRHKLKGYQKEGVRAIEQFGGRALLADDMGLGKTIQALAFIHRRRVPTTPTVVVCPASVKYHWRHEAYEQIGMTSHILEGETPPEDGMLAAGGDLLIVNPDILPFWVPWLRRLNPKLLILDECQMFANIGTARTEAAQALAHDTPAILAMSGTPLTNRPAELWPTLNMIRPDLFPSFYTFAWTYCEPKLSRGEFQYKGAKDCDLLNKLLLETCMIRRHKKNVLGDLLPKDRSVDLVDLHNADEYQYCRNHFGAWADKNLTKTKARKAKSAEAVTKVGYLLRLAARLKTKATVGWINEWLETNPDEKLTVFASHKKMIKALERRCEAGSVVVDGSVSTPDRHAAVQRFQRDRGTRLFLGNTQACGTGMNGLQHVCRTAAFAELPWKPGTLIQAEDRLHRIGQEGGTDIHYLIAAATIEERLCQLIQRKQRIIDTTLDGAPGLADVNILDQLTAEVQREVA